MDISKNITVRNEFSISVPSDARWYFESDEATFVIRLNTKPATEILIGRYDFSPHECAGILESLQGIVKLFCERCVTKAIQQDIGYSICPSYEVENNTYMAQGIANWGGRNYWIVRAYSIPNENGYYLLHWNGNKTTLAKVVLHVFESFQCVPSLGTAT